MTTYTTTLYTEQGTYTVDLPDLNEVLELIDYHKRGYTVYKSTPEGYLERVPTAKLLSAARHPSRGGKYDLESLMILAW